MNNTLVRALALAVALVCATGTHAATETVVYNFCSQTNCTDGVGPQGVLLGSGTILYGATAGGGANGDAGTVFALTRSGSERVLYSFCTQANCTDGQDPQGIIRDRAGNIYGTTQFGGANGKGTVFKLAPDGSETVLYSFCAQANCTDGALPMAPPIEDSAGNLYGTAISGGSYSRGVAFKLAPDGTYTVLYSFCVQGGTCPDGGVPQSGLVEDASGNLYGVAQGGANGAGAVFRIAPDGSESLPYSFCALRHCTDGDDPAGNLVMGGAGNLYGTTRIGGDIGCALSSHLGCGTVFKITPAGQETVLYIFEGQGNGAYPQNNGLRLDGRGNLYGTTAAGGTGNCPKGCGTIFKIGADGTEVVLYAFCSQTNCTDGQIPVGGLAAPSLVGTKDVSVYGTTQFGGGAGGGVVFRLSN